MKRKHTWPTSEYVSKKRKEFHGKRKLRTGDLEAFDSKFVQFASESESKSKKDTIEGKKKKYRRIKSKLSMYQSRKKMISTLIL